MKKYIRKVSIMEIINLLLLFCNHSLGKVSKVTKRFIHITWPWVLLHLHHRLLRFVYMTLFYFLSAFSTHIHAHVRTLKLTHTLTHAHSHTHSHTYTQTKLVLHVKASLSCVMVNRRQIKIYVWICSGHFFFFFQ